MRFGSGHCLRWLALVGWAVVAVVQAGVARAEGPFGGSVTAVVQADGQPLWLGTERGLFRFSAGRWDRVRSWGVRHVTALSAVEDVLLVGWRRNGLWRSPDGGKTWTRIVAGLHTRTGTRVRDVVVLVVDPGRPGTVYLGSSGQGIFLSEDLGASWTRLDAGLEESPPPAFHVTAVLPGQGPRPLLMGTDGAGVFRWVGSSWHPVQGLPQGVRVSALSADPADPRRVFLGTRGKGLWQSSDAGVTWIRVRQGRFGIVTALAVGPGGRWIASFAGEGLILPSEPRPRIVRIWSNVGVRVLRAAEDGGWIAGLVHDGLWRLDPAGQPVAPVNTGLDATAVLTLWQDPDGSLWCGDTNGVFLSEDGGRRWEPRDTGLPGAAVQVLLRAGGSLYAGTRGRGVFRWDATRASWVDVSEGMGTANTVFSLAWDGTHLYAGTEGGVLRRAGAAWERVSRGLPASGRWLVAADTRHLGRVWAAGAGGLYVSENSGTDWVRQAATRAVALGLREVDGIPWVLEVGGLSLPEAAAAPLESGEQFTTAIWWGGRLWAGTDQGVGVWGADGFQRMWSGARVLCILPLPEGALVGTDGMGVQRVRLAAP